MLLAISSINSVSGKIETKMPVTKSVLLLYLTKCKGRYMACHNPTTSRRTSSARIGLQMYAFFSFYVFVTLYSSTVWSVNKDYDKLRVTVNVVNVIQQKSPTW